MNRPSTVASPSESRFTETQLDPLPVLLVRRGPVGMRSLTRLHSDERLELFAVDELTSEWIAFANRVAGILVASEGDPLSAFGYAITAGMTAPIAVLTTRRYKSDAADLMAAGAVATATMPLTTVDVDRIVPLFAKHAAFSRIDSTLRLLLDPIGRVVRYHDKSVRLSQREFAVLHCMSSHRGRPVAAEELLAYVWADADPAEHTRQILDVYIFQLRKKLEHVGLTGAISTVRGFGYALAQVTREQGSRTSSR